jgi:hypothetical protein
MDITENINDIIYKNIDVLFKIYFKTFNNSNKLKKNWEEFKYYVLNEESKINEDMSIDEYNKIRYYTIGVLIIIYHPINNFPENFVNSEIYKNLSKLIEYHNDLISFFKEIKKCNLIYLYMNKKLSLIESLKLIEKNINNISEKVNELNNLFFKKNTIEFKKYFNQMLIFVHNCIYWQAELNKKRYNSTLIVEKETLHPRKFKMEQKILRQYETLFSCFIIIIYWW